VGDISLSDDGVCALPPERFHHWAERLERRFPPSAHPALYQMLGGIALELARRRAFAAVQLFALATAGLEPKQAERLERAVAADDEARRAAAELQRRSTTAPPPGGLVPPDGKGASLRRRK
jgi:hypothetical protein